MIEIFNWPQIFAIRPFKGEFCVLLFQDNGESFVSTLASFWIFQQTLGLSWSYLLHYTVLPTALRVLERHTIRGENAV